MYADFTLSQIFICTMDFILESSILADAVGLGKTWSALAVIKYYQLQGRETILLCPKKLENKQNYSFCSRRRKYFREVIIALIYNSSVHSF